MARVAAPAGCLHLAGYRDVPASLSPEAVSARQPLLFSPRLAQDTAVVTAGKAAYVREYKKSAFDAVLELARHVGRWRGAVSRS